LKKEVGVNPRIFLKLEKTDGCKLQNIGEDLSSTEIVGNDLDDLFESSEEEEEYDAEDKQRRENARKRGQNTVVSDEAVNEIVKPEDKDVTFDEL
jgi:hypothetical protein